MIKLYSTYTKTSESFWMRKKYSIKNKTIANSFLSILRKLPYNISYAGATLVATGPQSLIYSACVHRRPGQLLYVTQIVFHGAGILKVETGARQSQRSGVDCKVDALVIELIAASKIWS